jgi:hypothetical protein
LCARHPGYGRRQFPKPHRAAINHFANLEYHSFLPVFSYFFLFSATIAAPHRSLGAIGWRVVQYSEEPLLTAAFYRR